MKASERRADDTDGEYVPVCDTPKAAQIKAIERAQSRIARMADVLRNRHMGVFVASVPLNKTCASQKPSCDRNSDLLQHFTSTRMLH